jgi:hypothetical protein
MTTEVAQARSPFHERRFLGFLTTWTRRCRSGNPFVPFPHWQRPGGRAWGKRRPERPDFKAPAASTSSGSNAPLPRCSRFLGGASAGYLPRAGGGDWTRACLIRGEQTSDLYGGERTLAAASRRPLPRLPTRITGGERPASATDHAAENLSEWVGAAVTARQLSTGIHLRGV